MVIDIRQNLDVTDIPVKDLYEWREHHGWRIHGTRFDGERVRMDLWRPRDE